MSLAYTGTIQHWLKRLRKDGWQLDMYMPLASLDYVDISCC